MKVKEGNPHDTIEALGKTILASGHIKGKPVRLYPKFIEKMILDAMKEFIEDMKPYDMEDEDWRRHVKEKGIWEFFQYSSSILKLFIKPHTKKRYFSVALYGALFDPSGAVFQMI